MKSSPSGSSDPDIRASLAALKRAAKTARKIAVETATPLYVFKNGRIVNLNPRKRRPPQ